MDMKRYFIYFMAALLSLALSSCQDELTYQPGEPDAEDCYGVYFPIQSGTGDIQIEPGDPTYFKYTVRRMNTEGELHIPVKITDDAKVFSASEIVFRDEEPTAELVVYFPSIERGITYDCTIEIDDPQYASRYSENSTSIRFSVTMIQWNTLKGPSGETMGKYRDAVFQDWFSVSNKNCERDIQIQERDDMPGYYRMFDVYNASFMSGIFGSNMSGNCVYQAYTYVDATDPDKVWIPTFKCGLILHSDYGEISIGSYVTDNSADFGASITSVYGKLREGVIEFPSGSLQMKLEMLGWYSANNTGNHRIILPGYRAKEYEVELSVGVSGNNGLIPVDLEMGRDISQVWLAAFEGTLTETAAAAKAQEIADGTIAENVKKLKKDSSFDMSFDKTGMYSLVAVGFDQSGTIKAHSTVSFGYLNAEDAAGDRKEVILSCGLIASDKYAAEGLTAKNSLELYINGKNIQRLHAGIYEKSEWDSNPEAVLAEISQFQMTKATLDLVNGEGLSMRQGYLVPGTEYALVLKAYNGYREKVFVATRSTEGKWDARLAQYDMGDIQQDLIPANLDGYYGDYRYYAIENGMYSREYLGDVTISPGTGSIPDYSYATITGLFPHARKKFNMKDDRMIFVYLDGFLYNFEQAFDHFVYEGSFYYPMALMYTESGSAYGGRVGLLGGYVSDGVFAIIDSGQYADYNEVCSGFVLLAFADQSHTVNTGMLGIVTDMLLIRPDVDDRLIAENGPLVSENEGQDDDLVTMGQIAGFRDLIVRGPVNNVESFDGFIRSAIDQVRSGNSVRNLLDYSSVPQMQNSGAFELKTASFEAIER